MTQNAPSHPLPDPCDRVEQLLIQVLEASSADQGAAMAAACAAAPDLAPRLQARLRELSAFGMLAEPLAKNTETPASIGPYRVLSVLGQGGMGLVYLAEHTLIGRRVALKCIRPEFLGSDRARERFRRETQAIARLQHPGLATLYETGEWQGQPFLAMQFVDGERLDEQIQRARARGHTAWGSASGASGGTGGSDAAVRRQSCAEAVALVETLARAVHAVHETGVVHRDLKPGNVMVTPAGEPVLLDFGLARDLLDETGKLTLSSDIVGTPAYMAPEQVEPRGRTIDGRTDVHALGALLYECLTLRPPFAGQGREDTYRRILAEEPVQLRALQPAAGADLASVVHKALAKDPRHRFATALEFADELARVRRGEPTHTRPAGPLRRTLVWARKRPAVAATIVTAFAALGVGLAVAVQLLQQERAAIRTYEAVAMIERDPARAAVLAADALDAGGGEPARSALYAALDELRLVKSLPLWNSGTAVAGSADGKVLAAAIWGMADTKWESTVHLFREGEPVKNLLVAGRTRSLHLDEARDRLLVVGHLPSARLFDLHGSLVSVLKAQPDEVWPTLPEAIGERITFGVIAGGLQGDHAFTITRDGHVRVYDLRGQVLPERCLHVPKVDGADWIAADRDARTGHVLLGSRQGRVVHVAADGTAVGQPPQLDGPATFVAFAPQGGRMVAATGYRRYWSDIDGTHDHRTFVAVVFDASGWRSNLRGHTDHISDVQWSPDGTTLLTTSEDTTARLWRLADLRDHDSVPCTVLPHSWAVQHARFLADGTRLVTGMSFGDCALWDTNGRRLGGLYGHGSGQYAIGVVGADRVLTATMDLRLLVWDVSPRFGRQLFPGDRVATTAWVGDDLWITRLVGEVQVWNRNGSSPHRRFDVKPRLRPDEDLFATRPFESADALWLGTSLGRVLTFECATGLVHERVASLGVDRFGVAIPAGAFWPSGSTLYVPAPASMIPIAIDQRSAHAPVLRERDGFQLMSLSAHPARPVGASASTSAHVLLFDLTDGREIARSEGLGSTVMNAAWAGEDLLFAATRDGRVVALDSQLREIWRLELGVMQWHLALTPDRRHLMVSCADRHARVVSAEGKLVLALPEISGRMQSVRFSPDGRQVSVASFEGEVDIWPLMLEESGAQILDRSPYQEALDTARRMLGK